MKVAIRIVTLLLAAIAIGTGAKAVLSGLPAGSTNIIDNTFRFYAGVWFAVGLGLVHSTVFFEKNERVFSFLMRVFIVGGVARALGLLDYSPERPIVAAIAIEITVPLLLLFMRSRLAKGRTTSSLENGRSVLLTGANGGLGRETVKWLLEDGFSRVVMACRTEAKAVAARDEVVAEMRPGQGTDLEAAGGFDMTDPAKIEAAIAALPADAPFDVVFLQAGGVVFGDERETVEWNGETVEKTVFQNVVGAHVVLSRLAARGLLAPGARVVYAGGEGARGIPGMIELPGFETAEDLRGYVLANQVEPKPYNAMNAIGVSKLLGALWTTKLAELEGHNMSTMWFTPGLTHGTQGLSGAPPLRRLFLEKVGFPLMAALGKAQSPRDGARKYADCLVGKIGRNGDIIGAPEGTALGELTDQRPMNPAFDDATLSAELWRILEEIDGPFGRTKYAESAGPRAAVA